MFLSVPRSKQMFEVFRGTLSQCMDHIWENVYTFQCLFTFQVLLSRPGNEKASTHALENTLLYNLFDWEIAEFSHNVTLRLEEPNLLNVSVCVSCLSRTPLDV